jgi:hypothetical protein
MPTPAHAPQRPPEGRSGAPVCDLIAHRVLRALAERVRYRYVQPKVWRDGAAFRIESPCCSRNVEPSGGVIDIALLLPPGVTETADHITANAADQTPDHTPDRSQWRLYARNHAQNTWRFHEQAAQMDELLDMLCLDAQRVFWP